MKTQKFLRTTLFIGAALFAGAAVGSACSPVDREFGDPNFDGGTDAGLVCEPGSSAACFDGPQEKMGVGSCKAGTMICKEDGSGYGACDGQVLPSTDLCETPEDEDCDGTALLCPLTHLGSSSFLFPTDNGALFFNIAQTPDGNALVLTHFAGTLNVGGMDVTSFGAGSDLLLVKLDPLGKVLWAKALGGDTSQHAGGVAVDKAGMIYITGSFDGALDLGKGGFFQTLGSSDIFLAKLDPNGDPIAGIQAGAMTEEDADKIAVDPDGNIIIAGTFSGPFSFAGGPVMNPGPNNIPRIFVAKFDPNLGFLASIPSAGTGSQSLRDMTVGLQGNPIITGSFNSTIDFGGIAQTTTGADDIFITKLNSADLKPLWVRQYGGQMDDEGRSVDVDSTGDIVLTGNYQAEMVMGKDDLIANANVSVFLTKLMPTGDPIWAKSLGSAGIGGSNPVVRVDSGDHVLIGGNFTTAQNMPGVDLGGGPLQSSPGSGTGPIYVYIGKLSPAGDHIASKAFSNAALEVMSAIGIMPGDRIMITGGVVNQIDFGGGLVGATPMGENFFFATFSP